MCKDKFYEDQIESLEVRLASANFTINQMKSIRHEGDNMTHGMHETTKDKNDKTFSPEWSGVSYAPHCDYGCTCPDCETELHLEGQSSHYCPRCDEFKRKLWSCPNN